jgi:uncharacterized protein
MFKNTRSCLMLILAIAFAAPVLADNDPSLSQVYQEARTGHLSQAQRMMDQVLRDHPRSAKAHFVTAELYAAAGNPSMARQELNIAEALDPGLPFATPASVRALQRDLSHARGARALPVRAPSNSSLQWGTVALVIIAGVGVLLFILRRRSPTAYSPYSGQYPGAAPTPPGALGGSAGVVGGGVGSGIAGNVASGLAVGAGVVAGEEIARHFLDPGRNASEVPPPANPPAESAPVGNPEGGALGGPDFGVSGGGSSWDDDETLGGDGNDDDDWT